MLLQNRMWMVVAALVVLGLALSACQSTGDLGATGPVPATAKPADPETAPLATATVAPTVGPGTQPAGAPGPIAGPPPATSPASHPPTATSRPQPTASPPDTPPPAPVPAEILAFGVTPPEAGPGDTVTLTWEARGERAILCPTARFVLFSEADCRPVALSGTTTFAIPPEAAGFQYIELVLRVESGAAKEAATARARVAFPCDRAWFFSGEPQAGICPRAPLTSYAAAQLFEQGMMIWLENPGRYYVLLESPVLPGADRKRVEVIDDPLEILEDTASAFEPPGGLYAPVSGFGLVWRGDVRQSPGYHRELGWALAPEFGYEAALQCDDALPSGGRSWQTCYLQGPAGRVIELHPLGGWRLLEASETP